MEKTLDISSLPDKAKGELLDFYEFLQGKYGHSKTGEHQRSKGGSRFKAFLSEPVHVSKVESISRDALHERR
jgi:hypothetical protein